MSELSPWKSLSQAALDAAYNNMAAVPESAARIARLTERSATLRGRLGAELEIPYGAGPRNRFDVFRSGMTKAPLVAFIHGGWWQRNSKEVFSAVAEGPLAHGIDVALLGYTLAPDATLTAIAAEIGTGLDVLMQYQDERGAPARCVLSGWSAGGHLAALAMNHPAVTAGLSISGVFDLEPIRASYINDKLMLTAEEVAPLSPMRQKPAGKPLALAFGLNELPEMQRQSADYGVWCAQQGHPAMGYPLAGHDHFSILDEMVSPTGSLTVLLRALVMAGAA